MFRNKSKNPVGFAMDTWLDALLKKSKKKPSHKKRNATVAIVVGSALVTGFAGRTKKKSQP